MPRELLLERRRVSRVVSTALGVVSLAALTLVAADAHAGCEADDQCKGDRICEAGICVQPTTPVAQPAPPVAQPAPSMVPTPTAPPAYAPRRTERRGILGLTIAGPIVLGVSWLATIGVTAGLDSDGDILGYSAVPLAGPWIMMADERTGDYTAALAVSGVLQLGGLTMLVLGVSIRRDVEVGGLEIPLDVDISPLAAPGVAGLQVAGSF